MSPFPQDLKYTKDHEWAKLEGKTLTVGITSFAVEQLGDIVYLELPKPGTAIKAGERLGVVESTKAVSDVYSPVSGTVKEANAPASDSPETVNQDPYGKGWLVKLELADPKELEALMDAGKYEAHTKTAGH